MRDISKAQGIGIDPDYLNGNLVTNQTIASLDINQDAVQFFQKLMALAELTPNGEFDNEVNGYQTIEALQSLINNTFKHITYEIGAWNMDTDATKPISAPIPAGYKPVMLKASILEDGGTGTLQDFDGGREDGTTPYFAVSTETIYLTRKAGGIFDNAGYSSAALNRGYVIVFFESV